MLRPKVSIAEATIDFEIGDIVETYFRSSGDQEEIILYHQLILSEKSLVGIPEELQDVAADYQILYLTDFTGLKRKSVVWARFILRKEFGFSSSRILYKINQ